MVTAARRLKHTGPTVLQSATAPIPIAPGLTLARLAERAISVGLSPAIDELLTTAREMAGAASSPAAPPPGAGQRGATP